MKKSILFTGVVGAFIALLVIFQPKATPADVVVMWNNGLYDANYDLVEKHTSSTSVNFIEKNNGLLGLIKKYQDSANKKGRGLIEIISHSVNGDKAIVNYKALHDKTGESLFWQDTLFLEDEVWKVAPQFATVTK